MDTEIFEESDEKLRFVIEDISPAFANALRRTMMSKVPTMAVREVDFVDNTSGLFDEMVSHRIGMIPWEYDPEHYEVREDGEDETPTNSVTFVLEKEGKGTVYSKDMKPTDRSVGPVFDEIPITKLKEDQRIELEARAELGTGEEHAKFQAANVAYQYRPTVKLNGSEVDNPEDAARVAPDEVKEADGPVEADEHVVYAMEETIDVEEGDEVLVEEDDTSFVFEVESVSGHDARYIVETAIDILMDELDEFESAASDALA